MGVEPKNWGGPFLPPQIHGILIGFSISMIFTIHFGGKIPLFLETPKSLKQLYNVRLSLNELEMFLKKSLITPKKFIIQESLHWWPLWSLMYPSWFDKSLPVERAAAENYRVIIV